MTEPLVLITTAPRWLVRHVCRPEGHAMPKRPLSWYTTKNADDWNVQRLPSHYQTYDQRQPHLGNGDYRYWAETREFHWNGSSRVDEIRVVCRWCQHTFSLKEFEGGVKYLHKKTCAYAEQLNILFQALRVRKNCVVCSKKTHIQKWGIPLCDSSCQNTWRYSTIRAFDAQEIERTLRLAGKLKLRPI